MSFLTKNILSFVENSFFKKYIYIYIGVRDLPLRDMISLGAWRTGLGCSGKILPLSSPSFSPTRIWEGGSYQFHYDSGAFGMRGSIRLVFRVPTASVTRKVVVGQNQIYKQQNENNKH